MHKNITAFLCKIPPKQNNKKSSQCTKKVFKKSFFVQIAQNFQKITKNFKKAIAIFLIIGYNSTIR